MSSSQYKLSFIAGEKYFTSTPTNDWSYSGYLEAIEPYFSNRAKISTLKSTWKKRFNDHLRDLEKDEIDERRVVASALIGMVSNYFEKKISC